MQMTRKMKTILTLAAFLAFGCGAMALPERAAAASWSSGMPAGCKSLLKKIKREAGWRAFALSNVYYVNGGPLQSCGWAAASPDKAMAKANAMKSCRAQLSRTKAPASALCVIKLVSK